MNFKDTIRVFDQAFTVTECQQLINRQEQAIKEGLSYKGMSGDGVNEYKKSTDYNILDQNNDLDDNLSRMVIDKFNQYTDQYLNEFPHGDVYDHNMIVNDKTGYPLLQIQKYDKGSGHYNAWHVEKENADTAVRQFVYILYLNNVTAGGETGFLFKEPGAKDFYKVKPVTGKLIIHPASWPYIHKGYMPVSDDKYILTTWLQYTE